MALTVNQFIGFETGGLEEAASTINTPDATEATVVRSGIRSLKCEDADSYAISVFGAVSDAGGDRIFGVAFQVDNTSPTNKINSFWIRLNDTLNGGIFEFEFDVDGDIEFQDSTGSIKLTITNPLTADQWHFLELYYQPSATGNYEVFLDGVSRGSGTGDFDTGTAAGNLILDNDSSSGTTGVILYYDDFYFLSGATAATDRLGGSSISEMPEVFMYQNTAEDATDQGDTLADGTWALVGEIPLNEGTSNDAQYQDTGNLTGSTICDEGSRAGPSGDANIDGDSNIKAAKFIGRFMRGTGGGRTHSFLHGNSGDGVTASADMGLNVGFETRTIISEAASIVPLSTESFQHGFSKSATAGQDIFCGEIWAMLLHVPDVGGNTETIIATATGVPVIRLHISKTLAATAVVNPTVTRKTLKTLAATAVGIAALTVTKLINTVSVAATAVGVTALRLKAKIGLTATVTGTPALGKFIRKTIAAVATGVGRIIKKVFLTLPTSTGGFLMFASEFDAMNDWLNRASNLSGISDSKVGIMSFWYLSSDDAFPNQIIYQGQSGAGIIIRLQKQADDTLDFFLFNRGSSTTLLNLLSTTAIKVTNGWNHILISWDMNIATPRAELYLNDVDDSNIIAGPIDGDADYTNATKWFVGSATAGGSVLLNGCLAQLYFNPSADLDLSTTSNRRKFINADLTPADLGFDGSNPTGNIPIVYLHKKAVNFHENSGTGGDFVQNGTLTDCPPPHGVIATLTKLRTAFVTITATAQGVVSLTKKAKLKLGATATGVADVVANAIVAAIFVAIDAIATGVVSIQLKVKKLLAGTAMGVPTLSPRSIFRIALAVTTSGIVTLTKKVKLGLSDTAIGIVALKKKAKLNLNATATGTASLVKKAKLILRATATGAAALIVNAISGATLVTINAIATAIATIQLTVKKRLEAVSLGIPALDPRTTFKLLLVAVGAGVATLKIKTIFRKALVATAEGVASLTKKAKLNVRATATGVAKHTNKIFKTLKVAGEGVVALSVISATLIAVAVVALGIPALRLKVKKGLVASGAGVAKIRKFVSKTLRVIVIGVPTVNELGPTVFEKLKTRIIGFFGGPGGGPGR